MFIFDILPYVAAIVVILISIGVIYTRWNYGVLENTLGLGVVIPPYFIGGSDPLFYERVVCEDDLKRVRKYGDLFGMYEGRQPRIFINDPETIRQVFVQDFEQYFHSKRTVDGGHGLINEMMDVLPYDKWKVVRAHFSPQLTTSKIKAMSIQMLVTVEEFVTKLSQQSDGQRTRIDPKQIFTSLTVDVIARCAFGSKIDAFDNPDSEFIRNVNALALEDQEPNFLFSFIEMFPHLFKIVPMVIPRSAIDYFGELLQQILAQRRLTPKRDSHHEDFVDVVNSMIAKINSSPIYRDLGISETTAMAQAAIFLVAGFETTSTTSALLAWHLAKDPVAQEAAISEIDAFHTRHGSEIKHEHLPELVYLNACINETLRLHPPVIRIERECGRDWKCERLGLEVRRGTTIMASAFGVHYDPRNYPDPECRGRKVK